MLNSRKHKVGGGYGCGVDSWSRSWDKRYKWIKGRSGDKSRCWSSRVGIKVFQFYGQ